MVQNCTIEIYLTSTGVRLPFVKSNIKINKMEDICIQFKNYKTLFRTIYKIINKETYKISKCENSNPLGCNFSSDKLNKNSIKFAKVM